MARAVTVGGAAVGPHAKARGLVRLAHNESALGPSPRATAAARRCLEGLGRYPDAAHTRLKASLATRLGCSTGELSIGNGSSEVIDGLFRALGGAGGNIVAPRLSFVAYRSAAEASGRVLREAPLARELAFDVEALVHAMNDETRFVVLANPNNPTGAALDAPGVRRLASACRERQLPLVLDYAYWEYAAGGAIPAPLPIYGEFSNIVLLRTFSKAYGLAGLRVGYAVAAPEIVARLERRRQPFNVTEAALAAACAALEDEAHLARVVAANAAGRAWLLARLTALGAKVHAGPTSFLLLDAHAPARPLHQRLLERGVAVGLMDAYGLDTCLRITIGSPEDNQRLFTELSALL